jgi:hypothetical protein
MWPWTNQVRCIALQSWLQPSLVEWFSGHSSAIIKRSGESSSSAFILQPTPCGPVPHLLLAPEQSGASVVACLGTILTHSPVRLSDWHQTNSVHTESVKAARFLHMIFIWPSSTMCLRLLACLYGSSTYLLMSCLRCWSSISQLCLSPSPPCMHLNYTLYTSKHWRSQGAGRGHGPHQHHTKKILGSI